MRRLARLALAAALSASAAWAAEGNDLEAELRAAESAFARSMADRDLAAFRSFLDDEAIFFGRTTVLRGKAAVVEGWKRYFEGPTAPFSWRPEEVAVVESGRLGLTSGPVFDPAGAPIGSFQSTWRRDAEGRWRIVLDKGCPPCDCEPRPAEE